MEDAHARLGGHLDWRDHDVVQQRPATSCFEVDGGCPPAGCVALVTVGRHFSVGAAHRHRTRVVLDRVGVAAAAVRGLRAVRRRRGSLPHPGGLPHRGWNLSRRAGRADGQGGAVPLSTQPDQVPQVIALVALAIVIVIMSATSRSRARLGVQGSRGESMFVDLRDRLRAFGELLTSRAAGTPRPPSSPPTDSRSPATSSWRRGRRTAAGSRSSSSTCRARACRPGRGPCCCPVRSAVCSASRSRTGSSPRRTTTCCARTGTRASRRGARLDRPRHRRLHDRQRRAPAAVQFNNGSGRWRCWARPPGLLGVIDDATYVRSYRRLGRGDALVLYTDGVVESGSATSRWGRSDAGRGRAPRARRVRRRGEATVRLGARGRPTTAPW